MPPATQTCFIFVFLQTDVLLLPCGGCFVWRSKDSMTEKEEWQRIKDLEAFPVPRDLACFMEQMGISGLCPSCHREILGIWDLWPLYRKQTRQKGLCQELVSQYAGSSMLPEWHTLMSKNGWPFFLPSRVSAPILIIPPLKSWFFILARWAN